jgi:hypothetical protein
MADLVSEVFKICSIFLVDYSISCEQNAENYEKLKELKLKLADGLAEATLSAKNQIMKGNTKITKGEFLAESRTCLWLISPARAREFIASFASLHPAAKNS